MKQADLGLNLTTTGACVRRLDMYRPHRRRHHGVDNPRMSTPKILFGFHAVGVRLKTAPASVIEVYADPTRPRKLTASA